MTIKVNFVIGGAQKGGTSALDTYLRGHPSILMAKHKELHFFDKESHFSASPVDYAAYHANFDSGLVNSRLLGESTPIYMYWYPAPRRIWEYNSEMKWILILRNPIERAFSNWNMERICGREHLPFIEAIFSERERCRSALPVQHRYCSYIDRGFYTEQIRRIWHFFPKEQTLFLKSEELNDHPNCTLGKVCSFLGIEQLHTQSDERIHVGQYTSRLSEEEREQLIKLFEIEIHVLEKLLGWDCSSWLKK